MSDSEALVPADSPPPGMKWSERLRRMIPLEASGVSGIVAPLHGRFRARGDVESDRKRARGGLISGIARKKLAEVKEGTERGERIATRWLDRAEEDRGDLELLLGYVEGRPRQSLSIETTPPPEIEGVDPW